MDVQRIPVETSQQILDPPIDQSSEIKNEDARNRLEPNCFQKTLHALIDAVSAVWNGFITALNCLISLFRSNQENQNSTTNSNSTKGAEETSESDYTESNTTSVTESFETTDENQNLNESSNKSSDSEETSNPIMVKTDEEEKVNDNLSTNEKEDKETSQPNKGHPQESSQVGPSSSVTPISISAYNKEKMQDRIAYKYLDKKIITTDRRNSLAAGFTKILLRAASILKVPSDSIKFEKAGSKQIDENSIQYDCNFGRRKIDAERKRTAIVDAINDEKSLDRDLTISIEDFKFAEEGKIGIILRTT